MILLAFVEPLFEFIEAAIARGDSILIHCLAGAHRAGTTGVACLVHYLRCEPGEAITIGEFYFLSFLSCYEYRLIIGVG